MQIACRTHRTLIPPAPHIVIRQAGAEHPESTESESRLWKVTSETTGFELLSAEDGLLILFGFISGCAIASSFGQILGLFA
jgi:hypothetical protein